MAMINVQRLQAQAINLVNPRLKNYSNPFILAITIGVSSTIIFIIMLISFSLDCPVIRDGPLAITPVYAMRSLAKAGNVDCWQAILSLSWQGGSEGMMLIPMETFSLETVGGGEWCTSHKGIADPESRVDGPLKDELLAKWQELNYGIKPPTLNDFNTVGLAYDHKDCPNFWTSLALALAYTVYIEMGCTIVVVILFQALGLSTPLDKSKTLSSVVMNEGNEEFEEEWVKQVKKMIKDATDPESKNAENAKNAEKAKEEASL